MITKLTILRSLHRLSEILGRLCSWEHKYTAIVLGVLMS